MEEKEVYVGPLYVTGDVLRKIGRIQLAFGSEDFGDTISSCIDAVNAILDLDSTENLKFKSKAKGLITTIQKVI